MFGIKLSLWIGLMFVAFVFGPAALVLGYFAYILIYMLFVYKK
jgi:hypothetical protein